MDFLGEEKVENILKCIYYLPEPTIKVVFSLLCLLILYIFLLFFNLIIFRGMPLLPALPLSLTELIILIPIFFPLHPIQVFRTRGEAAPYLI